MDRVEASAFETCEAGGTDVSTSAGVALVTEYSAFRRLRSSWNDLAKKTGLRRTSMLSAEPDDMGELSDGDLTIHMGRGGAMGNMLAASDLVLSQVKSVLDAYAAQDLPAAMAVWKGDEEVDAICTSLFRELLTYMMEDPRNISFCIHLMFCAKNIERIGDHATNIAETVFYMIEGQQMLDKRPKGDMTNFAATVPNS